MSESWPPSEPEYPLVEPLIVVREDSGPALGEEDMRSTSESAAKHPPRSAPKWQVHAMDRLKAGIRRFSKPLAELVTRDANEGDTRLLVTDFLCEALGYDKYEDLTTEYQVKGEYADYGIRIDKELIAFIEVKRVATKLAAKHLRQAQMYAVNEGVEWIVLTNGVNWLAYHLSAGLPVEMDLALDVNLLGDETLPQKANQLFYLSRESMTRRKIDELWRAKRATSPKSLAGVLTSDAVVEAVRKQLRRDTGQQVDTSEVARLLKETVIRPECFEH